MEDDDDDDDDDDIKLSFSEIYTIHPLIFGRTNREEWHRWRRGEPEGKRPLVRPRRRWENNIKTDPQELGYVGMEWISLAQDRDRWRALVTAVMNIWVLKSVGNTLSSWEQASFSRRTLVHGVCKRGSVYRWIRTSAMELKNVWFEDGR